VSIPSRLWRFLRSEVNHRLGRFAERIAGAGYRDEGFQGKAGTEDETTSAQETFSSKEDLRIAGYYRVLELPYGADFATVKSAYKTLMKQYHPDKFQDAEKKQIATEVVKKLNEAYAELEKWLEAKQG
jgi:DnaJ-class molecular chaperone